ncbi:MAG: nicotinate-nucleotide adenylyltransferase [Geitlerinemataceae cyanobacterium]
MIQIALFGTSADPPNIAHRAILQWLSQHFDRVAIWASDNPFKSNQTSIEHRWKMLKLTIEDLQNGDRGVSSCHNISVYPQLSSSKALYSVQKAKSYWSNATFTFVIGADLVPQLSRWYCFEELLQQVRILVIPRPGCSIDPDDLETLRKIGCIEIADLQMPDVSSTLYRKTKEASAISDKVKYYIDQENLYRS